EARDDVDDAGWDSGSSGSAELRGRPACRRPSEPDLGNASVGTPERDDGGRWGFPGALFRFDLGREEGAMATNVATGQGLEPIAREGRQLGARGFAVLWGDLGIGLLVLLAGSFLVPALSLPQALGAIVVGSVIGVVLLGLTGLVGSQTGLPTMVC